MCGRGRAYVWQIPVLFMSAMLACPGNDSFSFCETLAAATVYSAQHRLDERGQIDILEDLDPDFALLRRCNLDILNDKGLC